MWNVLAAVFLIGLLLGLVFLIVRMARKKPTYPAVIMILLSLCLICGFSWIGAEQRIPKETDDYHVSGEMLSMAMNLPTVIDVDTSILDRFFDSLNTVSYRARGMVTEYEEETLAVGGEYNHCYLESDGLMISVIFGSGEEVSNGEYIEIVGELSSIDVGGFQNYATFSIRNAHIVERGATVREHLGE